MNCNLSGTVAHAVRIRREKDCVKQPKHPRLLDSNRLLGLCLSTVQSHLMFGVRDRSCLDPCKRHLASSTSWPCRVMLCHFLERGRMRRAERNAQFCGAIPIAHTQWCTEPRYRLGAGTEVRGKNRHPEPRYRLGTEPRCTAVYRDTVIADSQLESAMTSAYRTVSTPKSV